MRLTIFVTALALLTIPTIARAHAGNPDPNVVHACIGNINKIVRIVGVSGSCIAAPPVLAETAAHWSIQGPPGAPGTNGSNGTNGTNGANGQPGANGTNGTNGSNGTDGINGTSVTFVDYFSGNEHGCPNGGAIYAAGTPPVNAYVCNGINGINGTNGANGTNGTTARADGPCFDNTNRYVNCGNGTVTDTVTGLIWLRQADCFTPRHYAGANQAAAGMKEGDCGLTDGSSAGDWRLPTKDEWIATLAEALRLGCTDLTLPLTNDEGTACQSVGLSSFLVVSWVSSHLYWSSSTREVQVEVTFPNTAPLLGAWYVHLTLGWETLGKDVLPMGVWPVRGGTR